MRSKYSGSVPDLRNFRSESPEPSLRRQILSRTYEYEDIIDKTRSPSPSYSSIISDILARESDVTISNIVVPHTEYKGFSLYVLITVAHIVWLLWTFVPDHILQSMGIEYYPDKRWSLVISCSVLMGMLYVYIALPLWNYAFETRALDDINTITDEKATVVSAAYAHVETNGVWDMRIQDVNRILYGGQ